MAKSYRVAPDLQLTGDDINSADINGDGTKKPRPG
jgi:hypothetical protein